MLRLWRNVLRFAGRPLATVAVLIVAGLFSGIASSEPDPVMAFQSELSELAISFPVQSPEVAAYFDQIARPQDIATLSPSNLHLLEQDATGHKMVGYRSWADAERELDTLVGQIDMVMYNPEHWELTPTDEQQDLTAIVQEFAQFAHARGLQFMFAPDRRYADTYLSQVAPYVDSVLLQGQRLQHDPQVFASWILKMSEVARTANPDIQVYVQVGATLGPASEMLAAIQTVSNDIDGIAIWSMPRSLGILEEFVTLLRESPPSNESALSPSPTLAPAKPGPTESEPATPLPTPTTATPAPSTPDPTAGKPATPTPTDPPGQNRVAIATPSPVMERTPPTPTPAQATSTPTPTSTVTLTQDSLALVQPDESAVELFPVTAVPPLVSLTPELEQDAQARAWLDRIVMLLVGIAVGFMVGMAIGFLLGFGSGRRRRWG